MTDPELDDLLRRYRPAGPPAELRARLIASAAPMPRTWPWAAAAAALLAAVCVTQLWTRNVYEGVRRTVVPAWASALSNLPALESAVEKDPLLRERIEALARQERSEIPSTLVDAGILWQ
jgi:hypothetical protein